jgi:hypothetical protein
MSRWLGWAAEQVSTFLEKKKCRDSNSGPSSRVDYILYVSEEGAACIFGEKDGERTHIPGVGEFKPDRTKLTAVPSTQNKCL